MGLTSGGVGSIFIERQVLRLNRVQFVLFGPEARGKASRSTRSGPKQTSMDHAAQKTRLLEFLGKTLIIVGGYGSGKSEVAVNLCRHLARAKAGPVTIVDLDIVNPYFRSREAAARLRELGIRTVNPENEQFYADLPIILPEVKGAIQHREGTLVLDVGGDDVGARVLSTLSEVLLEGDYELFLVLNANRPFTSDLDSCLKMMQEIEASSRLAFTGIISNSHLLEDTTAETVLEGLKLARKVSKRRGLPVVFTSAISEVEKELRGAGLGTPVLRIDRSLLKPWEREAAGDENG